MEMRLPTVKIFLLRLGENIYINLINSAMCQLKEHCRNNFCFANLFLFVYQLVFGRYFYSRGHHHYFEMDRIITLFPPADKIQKVNDDHKYFS